MTSRNNSDLEAQIKRLEAELRSGTDMSELEEMKKTRLEEYRRVLYGVDICFLMDCTGSMGSWINITKDKILEVYNSIRNIKAKQSPSFRVAFLGYRDYGDPDNMRFVDIPFFSLDDSQAVASFQRTLGATQADGGGDGPEDIAGAMNYALTKMSWKSSTRLVIHFADAPCHGNKYHSAGGDSYPRGDPAGLVPEQLLEQFASKKIRYYFAEINSYTTKMTNIFASHMMSINRGDMFKVIPMSSGVESFLPQVVDSVRESMQWSGLGQWRATSFIKNKKKINK